jgi:tripartite-type tricarboxylate transporter receptor subunit TctC
MTGVQMNHVPYRGSAPALTDLLAAQVEVDFDVITSSIQPQDDTFQSRLMMGKPLWPLCEPQ